MADLFFYCALCGHSLAIGPEHAGELVECYACHRVVPVPGYAPPTGGQRDWLPAFPADILAVEIKFQCGRCESKLRVDARWEGRRLRCPHCASDGRVPVWSRVKVGETGSALSLEEIAFLSGEDSSQPLTVASVVTSLAP